MEKINAPSTSNPSLAITKAILLIKADSEAALPFIQQFQKEMKQSPEKLSAELEALLDYAKGYATYKAGHYQQLVDDYSKRKTLTSSQKLLLAQAYSRMENMESMIEVYSKVMPDAAVAQDMSDIICNMVYGAIISEDPALMEKTSRIGQDFLKKKNFSKELLLNLGLCYLKQNDLKLAKETIIRFQNMVKLDQMELENDEDYLTSNFILDYIAFSQGTITNYDHKLTE